MLPAAAADDENSHIEVDRSCTTCREDTTGLSVGRFGRERGFTTSRRRSRSSS
jgi:hypothetical protein